MTVCSSSIVECLREKGIQPTATASSKLGDSFKASNALDFSTDNSFYTGFKNSPQYLTIDFKRIVIIDSYQIEAPNDSDLFKKWVVSTSLDNKTWIMGTSLNTGFPGDTKYPLNEARAARYAKLDAGSTGNDQTFFRIYYIKFFGSLTGKVPMNGMNTIRRKKTVDTDLMRMILLISSS